MSHGTVSPESILPIADNALAGRDVNLRAQTNILARELVSDSRVLIEHARLLVRNSTSRIERVEKRLERLVAATEAAAPMRRAAGTRLSARTLCRFDRRDAA